VTGIDLVPYHVSMGRANADHRGVSTDVVVGDVRQLPFATDSFTVCTAIDSIVYGPEKTPVFESIIRVLHPGCTVLISDLLARNDVGPAGQEPVDAFADVWDMPSIECIQGGCAGMERFGFTVDSVQYISANSINRFQKWASLFVVYLIKPLASRRESSDNGT
jgi:ubiquinone/menaquinone biosynthesis C-methylase UbiE